ncbi:MAG: CDP-alcohol phosphatidyltransferase family protein [Propionibacteriaceae bacterium]
MIASRDASQQVDDDAPSSHPAYRALRQARGADFPAAGLTTTLAGFLVLLALLTPSDPGRLTLGTFVSVPLEAVLGIALLLLLPESLRSAAALLLGLVLGLLIIMKLLDIGFLAVLARPFNPAADWTLLNNAMRFLAGAIGPFSALGCLAGAVIFGTGLLILMAKSVQRLADWANRRNVAASRAVVVLATLWLSCAVFGTHIAPGVPVAIVSSADYLQHRHPPADAGNEENLAATTDVDTFAGTADDQLLTALRGKDVVLAFVESYGRSAIEDPEFASQVGSVLDTGNRRLRAAGFDSRSAYLTSPTAGGGSWLAHGTLLSGLWADTQQRYDALPSSRRLTLTKAFQRAGWRTIGVMPGNDAGWPESASLGYNQVYDAQDLGYRGPRFSWASMPDQYTLQKFEGTERAARHRQPVMAEVTLVSSHAPWEPIPRLVNWKDIGDGSVFNGMATADDPPQAILTRKYGRVRADYRSAIEYSLSSLISYVETYGNDNLVLIFLGDHQPSPIVTGYGVSRDVPITIVARDHSVLDRISDWGWQQGLRPNSQAPVWRMDAFRDRFLTAFGAPAESGHPAGRRH